MTIGWKDSDTVRKLHSTSKSVDSSTQKAIPIYSTL
jgi:hypothetical protein